MIHPPSSQLIFPVMDTMGLLAFAVAGSLTAIRKKLDLFGVVVLGIITALGGGILRDVLVQETPKAFLSGTPILTTVAGIIMAILLYRFKVIHTENNFFLLIFDAVGLGAFSVTGALVGLSHNLNFFGVVLLAILTGVGGGIMRDLLVNEIPLILQTDFYASASFLGATLLYLFHRLGGEVNASALMAAGFIIVIRIVAILNRWKLPKFK